MDDRMDDPTADSPGPWTPERPPQGQPRDVQGDTQQEGFAAAHAAEQNRLLAALPLEEYARLLPRLTPVRLGLKQVLVEPDAPIRDVYFPREGSARSSPSSRRAAHRGGHRRPRRVRRHPGPARRRPDAVPRVRAGRGARVALAAEEFRQITDERPAVRRLLLRYAQYYNDQSRSRWRATACTRSTSGARAGCS
jgi:hypothetical protein